MMLDQVEHVVLQSEKMGRFSESDVNEIFRCMHTIKGSSAMMMFDNITTLTHVMEDLFCFLREQESEALDFTSLADLVLDGMDFIKVEICKIINRDAADGNPDDLIKSIKSFLAHLKAVDQNSKPVVTEVTPQLEYSAQLHHPFPETEGYHYFRANLFFEKDCEMESLRAYAAVFSLESITKMIRTIPADLIQDVTASDYIRAHGCEIFMQTYADYDTIKACLNQTIFLTQFSLDVMDESSFKTAATSTADNVSVSKSMLNDSQTVEYGGTYSKENKGKETSGAGKKMISVHVEKLDQLMNLVGELVIAEAMVTQNPEMEHLASEHFRKASTQLHKITGELQDMVMAIRMVPLSTTFIRMQRIVRDMSKKLDKEVALELSGEETEVDKNIIEQISDPLMHLIRNAIDHGIEDEAERLAKGKPRIGQISLEAKNSGSDVLIVIRDDGRGLDKDKILAKAKTNGVLYKQEMEMTDREICNLILLPGFSTKDEITEFSGRGVGMDVVAKNLEAVGGMVQVESQIGCGTTITLKIPLTLAIIEGMNIRVGQSRYTIPITSIIESFRPGLKDCFMDPDKNEMVMVRGQCYPILRLHRHFNVRNAVDALASGILMMVEQDQKIICLFADELLGQQQVVVKALPHYIKTMKRMTGLAGCTLLGDGSISLILDISGLTGLRVR
jgi:two-component system chemotaxis sensor kinase CheA